jgi:hypothetical protein
MIPPKRKQTQANQAKTMLKKSLLLALLFPVYALAAITDYGSYFHDSDTGLYWLELTETRNQSYDDVEAQFQLGQPLEGWRYAKLDELEAFITAFGLPSQGNTCNYGNYCDNVYKQERHENLIRLFGDTYDAYLDETNASTDGAPNGKVSVFGYLGERGDVPGTNNQNDVYTAALRDEQLVNRVTQAPISDSTDSIYIGKEYLPYACPFTGSFLVRTTDPTIAQADPNDPNTLAVTIFDNLDPGYMGLNASVFCDPAGTGAYFELCQYDANEWYSVGANGHDRVYYGDFILQNTSFDQEARPWVRITGYDYAAGGCDSGDTDLGAGWCRKGLTNAPFSLMPKKPSSYNPYEPPDGIVPGSYIDHGDLFSLDNVELEFIRSNIQIDFNPWNSANTVRPKDAYFVTVGIKTLSVSDGDPIDFDASQVDPASVKLGPARAPNIANPNPNDFDGDGDTDMVFGFRVEDTGISCLDTTVTLVANTLSGDPLADQDVVLPIECEEIIDMDFDPFNAGNTIRPNDDYNVTVALLGMQVANGDAVDVTPGTDGADDIDPASLSIGPAGTSSIGTPVITDIDGDTHDDMLVTFNAFDAGIACDDTELEVTGEKISGIPVEAMDSIVTEDCDTGGCHP